MTAPALLCPSELAAMAAGAVTEMLDRSLRDAPIATYAESSPLVWSVLHQGGWDDLGVAEADGGAGASLGDLAEVARSWGARCAPLPLSTTLIARRWSAAAREQDDGIAIAVPVPATPAAACAPFAGEDRVVLAASLGTGHDELAPADVLGRDPFAPTLRLAQVPAATLLPATAAYELGVLWAAEAAGAAHAVLQESAQYARQRQQFGKPIATFQAIKHRLARMHEQAELADTAVRWAALDPQAGWRVIRHALGLSQDVIESSIQVHGGMGFTWEMGIHYYLRHVLTLGELCAGLSR